MMAAMALSLVRLSSVSGKLGASPFGRVMVTGSSKVPVSHAVSADFVAAVAHAPVVQPRFRGVALSCASSLLTEDDIEFVADDAWSWLIDLL